MGTLADSLFSALMGWVRALVSALWSLVSSDDVTILEFLGRNWLMIAVIIIAAGLVLDWVIWLLRWQPYHLWAQRARRLLRIEEPEDEEEEEALRARPAVTKGREKTYAAPAPQYAAAQPVFAGDEQEAMNRARSVPDRELGAYPGMLYDRENPRPAADLSRTQPFSVLSIEGPGAQEVTRRREEIDAYRRMQEEAAQRAREEAARRAEEERIAREEAAMRAEEERIARENAARSAAEEAARLAQAQYARELAEYEKQKAQYERDLAEYERQKAEYEAQMAAQEAAEHNARTRRRRQAVSAYEAYVPEEDVGELPDALAWPQMDTVRIPAASQSDDKKQGFLDRVAKIMDEPEDEEITGIRSLPPRVDRHDAYQPAKTPDKNSRRRR